MADTVGDGVEEVAVWDDPIGPREEPDPLHEPDPREDPDFISEEGASHW